MQELVDDCTWTYTTLNGKSGFNETGPSGSSIFLPETGRYEYEELMYSYGGYWTSTPNIIGHLGFDDLDNYYAEYAYFSDIEQNYTHNVATAERWKGLCFRPVL